MRRTVARGRVLPQSYSTDRRMGRLSLKACALFPLLWTNADDQGRLCGEPDEVKYTCCPNIDHITKADIPALLAELEQNSLIKVYETPKSSAIQLLDWWQVQRPQWAYPSEYPPPDGWKDRLRYHPRPDQVITENWVPPSQWDRELPSALPGNNKYEDKSQKLGSTLRSNTEKREKEPKRETEPETEKEKESPKRKRKVGSALPSAVSEETTGESKKRQKLRQAEAGVFLDSVEKTIGAKLVERPTLMGRIRQLLVKCPEATPERLLECFTWLKENDSFCRSRDSPTVIKTLPAKYPEWAVGKLPAYGGKEERHGRTGGDRQDTGSYEPPQWTETPEDADFSH